MSNIKFSKVLSWHLKRSCDNGIREHCLLGWQHFGYICFIDVSENCPVYFNGCKVREAAKKVLLLMAGPLRPNPPPLELNGRWKFGTLKKNYQKKFFFPLWPGL